VKGLHLTFDEDALSGFDESMDVIRVVHSYLDMEENYEEKELHGKQFELDSDGKIHFKIRQLLLNVTHFRDMLKEFRILEGFKLWRVKNEKSRMIVECKSDDYIWRICAPKITTITIKKTHLKEI